MEWAMFILCSFPSGAVKISSFPPLLIRPQKSFGLLSPFVPSALKGEQKITTIHVLYCVYSCTLRPRKKSLRRQ